jgi:hypothetical protein
MKKRSEVGMGAMSQPPLQKSEGRVEQARAKPPPVEFPSAQPAVSTDLQLAFERIVESVMVKDVEGTYATLQQQLEIGEDRQDHGRVMASLDRAETNARAAHNLWMTAKVEARRWELDSEVVNAAAREKAMKDLQCEKESGARTKQITDADVKARAALLFPDEVRSQELKRARVRALEASMQNLAEVWASRCRTLSTLATKMR